MSGPTDYQFLLVIPAHERQSALFLVEALRETAERFIAGVEIKSIGDPRGEFDLAQLRRSAAAYRNDSCPERTCENDRCGRRYRGPAVYCSLICAVDDAAPLGEESQLSIALETIGIPRPPATAELLEREAPPSYGAPPENPGGGRTCQVCGRSEKVHAPLDQTKALDHRFVPRPPG